MPASCDQLSEVKVAQLDTRQLDDFSSLFDTNFKKRVGHDALVPYCVVCPGNFVVDGITGLLSVTKYRCRNLCTVTGCEISPDRCKPYGSVPYCNSTSDKCYCLKYQCNNKEKNCSATVCREFERAECVLNKFGTSCKCIPLITTPYCNTGNTTCHLSNVDQADTHYFNGICQNLGSDYYAETCRRNGECRCVNTSPPCTVHGCESSVLRCGPEQTVPYCNATSNQCYCLKYQCDNLHKNCSATVCGPLERPECIFDEYGTSCKCVSFLDQCGLIGLPVCSSIVSRTDRQHYDNICQQLGSSYYAVECRGMRKCRCVERIDGVT
ncbi:hypothetical protein Fcan01_22268 [Folsomia candida]|uniref:Uncharacterized protein n=1 Tax=Folsomia candida TaxID=158441 RepID=A0A226DCX6_FOLCA|nr:hypothetical protein Fcan01_22268 [Folsomia candida]